MSGRKQLSYGGASDAKRLKVQVKTVEKWIHDYEKSLNTTLWLQFKRADRDNTVHNITGAPGQFPRVI